MKREIEHFARFLTMARDYGRSIGLKGNFLIEPKPMEPMKHQYDFDSATVVGFLKEHGLDKDFKLNIEANHATLSGHTFEHDLQVASDHGLLSAALLPHGLSYAQPRLRLASLDHAMWFHRDFRLDDWLLYVMDSPSAGGGRGLSRGSVFPRDGRLVASMAQEGMVRVRP